MDHFFGLAQMVDTVWIIPIMFSIHEVEEWNILRWYKKHYRNLPDSTNGSIRIHIITLGMLSFLLTLLAYIFNATILFSLIVIFISCFMLNNFLQHVIWTFQLKDYSPGLATASICMFAIGYINILYVQSKLIFTPLYCMVLLILPSLVRTMKVTGEMTPEIRNVHLFFIKVEKAFAGIFSKQNG